MSSPPLTVFFTSIAHFRGEIQPGALPGGGKLPDGDYKVVVVMLCCQKVHPGMQRILLSI